MLNTFEGQKRLYMRNVIIVIGLGFMVNKNFEGIYCLIYLEYINIIDIHAENKIIIHRITCIT